MTAGKLSCLWKKDDNLKSHRDFGYEWFPGAPPLRFCCGGCEDFGGDVDNEDLNIFSPATSFQTEDAFTRPDQQVRDLLPICMLYIGLPPLVVMSSQVVLLLDLPTPLAILP